MRGSELLRLQYLHEVQSALDGLMGLLEVCPEHGGAPGGLSTRGARGAEPPVHWTTKQRLVELEDENAKLKAEIQDLKDNAILLTKSNLSLADDLTAARHEVRELETCHKADQDTIQTLEGWLESINKHFGLVQNDYCNEQFRETTQEVLTFFLTYKNSK